MIIYISSPYSGYIERNVDNARKYCRYAVEQGHVPIAPHLLFPQFVNEETEREKALSMGLELMSKCDEVWVFGDEITAGMKNELEAAGRNKKKVRYFGNEMDAKERQS